MKILLILPYDTTYRCNAAFIPAISYQPLTLPILASLIPVELRSEVTLVDEGVQMFDYSKQHYDVVGISTVTSSAPRAYRLAAAFRRRGSYVFIGGHHATLLPEEASLHANTVFTGNSEETLPRFFYDYCAGAPRRLYRGERGCAGSAPLPRRDLLRKRGYLKQPTIIADYGCGNHCQYCVIHGFWGNSAKRPVEQVIAEIRALDARELLFLDPSPLSDGVYARELFGELEKLHIRWAGLSTVDAADDPELLELMRRSGCIGTLIGFESFHQQDLTALSKGHNRVKRYRRVVDAFHHHGIAVLGTFMLGLEHDTPEYLRELPDLIEKIGVDIPRLAVLTPYPSTPLFSRLAEDGRILTRNWALYDSIHCVFRPRHMSARELEQNFVRVWKDCYTPGRILRRLRHTPQHRLTSLATNLGFSIYSDRLRQYYHW